MKEFNGYKCACCGKDYGDFLPDTECNRCGCITFEKKRIPKENNLDEK